MATVSKKQLEESGFTNLRDYLNNERGLTRKGEPIAFRSADPITVDSEKNRSRGSRSSDFELGKLTDESQADIAMAHSDPDAVPKFLRAGESGNSRGSSKYRESGQEKVEKMKEADAEMLRESRRGMKKGGAVKKMANGGSASKRADGIAVKGKTRGKIC